MDAAWRRLQTGGTVTDQHHLDEDNGGRARGAQTEVQDRAICPSLTFTKSQHFGTLCVISKRSYTKSQYIFYMCVRFFKYKH